MIRTIFEEEHRIFRDSVREFVKNEIVPFHQQWEEEGIVPRSLWRRAGELGFLCMSAPEQYGGAGVDDFRYNAILAEEMARAGATGPGFGLQTDIVMPYLLRYATEEQKQRWLPGLVRGETISAMSTVAVAAATCGDSGGHGHFFLFNGAKTFIAILF